MRPAVRLWWLVLAGNGARGVLRPLAALHQLTWGLVNTCVGLAAGTFALVLLGGALREHRGVPVVVLPRGAAAAVTLGPVVIATGKPGGELLDHERGHWLQSVALGPLYFLVVGLPSLAHALWFRRRYPQGPHHLYFRFYTEAWADAWGGSWHRHGHAVARWWHYLRPGVR